MMHLVARVGVLPFGFWWDRDLEVLPFLEGSGNRIWESVPEFGVFRFQPFAIWVWGNCELRGLRVGSIPQPIPPREWTKPFMPFVAFQDWIRRHYQNATGVARECRLPVEFDHMPWCVARPSRKHLHLATTNHPAITYSALGPGVPLSMRLEGESVAAVVWGNYYREREKGEPLHVQGAS